MNFNDLDSGALVSRLCHYYLSDGDSIDQALQKIRSGLGGEYAAAIDTFESSLSANPKSSQVGINTTDSIISSLFEDVRLLGGDNSQLLGIANDVLNKVSPGFKACARFFSALFLYPSILFIISLIIYAVYKVFVFPNMVTGIFDQSVPRLTQIFFSDTAGVLIFIATIILVPFFIWQMLHLAKSFSQIKPRKSLLGALTDVDQHHAYIVFLSYFKILLKCGGQPAASLERAENYANLSTIKTNYYRHNKNALQVLKGHKSELVLQEVEFQLTDTMRGLDNALISKQEKILLLSQLSVVLFIGYMVIAMYLPIFKLASLL